MATRQPRRTRRRTPPATSLPRPVPTDPAVPADARAPAARRAPAGRAAPAHHRSHHVTTDYRYVRKDLTGIAVIGSLSLAFIFGMAIYIGAL